MISHSGGMGLLAIVSIFVALVVFGRAFAPLIRSAGLLIGLIGAVAGLIAAVIALGSLAFALVAGGAGWIAPPQALNVSGHPERLPFLLTALGTAGGCALVVFAVLAHLWGRKD